MNRNRLLSLRWLAIVGALLFASAALGFEQIVYYHDDLAGSPLAATGQSGTLLWKESYAPYGERQLNQDDANKIWFHGKPADIETGLSYFGARYYDPVIGRFMGVDPAGFNEKNLLSFNRYAYGNDNPYRFLDPDGHTPIDVVFLVYDVANLAHAISKGEGIGEAGLGVGISLLGVASPLPGVVQALRVAKAAERGVDAARAASKAATIREGIYEFREGEKIYCGQSCDIPRRLAEHVRSGKLSPDAISTVSVTEVIGGREAREIAEHTRIQEITGGVPARFSDKVSNKVDPIGPNRSHLLHEN